MKTLNKIGKEIHKSSKKGGGSYVVVGIVNCSRCGIEIEEREVTSPSKNQRKRGSYFAQYCWCHECKLYENKPNTRVICG